MAAKSLAQKMRLKPNTRALLLNAPEGFARQLEPLPDNLLLDTEPSGLYDWVQIFAKNAGELEEIAETALESLKPASLLWVSFPKGTSGMQSDLTRDRGWDALEGTDMKWVNLISVDGAWSAFCLRPYKPGEEKQSFR